MNNTTIATVRTTWNTTLLAIVASIIFKVTGWTITVDELLQFAPLLAPVVAIFYRASRVVADKWPKVGYILFGVNQQPEYHRA